MACYAQKAEIFFSLTRHQFAENLILFFGFYKGQKGDKTEFATKFVGFTGTIVLL